MQINIFNLVWFVISYYLAYKIGYYIITTGLKRFEIQDIPENKIKIYVLASLIIGLLFDSIIYPLFVPFLIAIQNKIVLIFVASVISFLYTLLISLLLSKYYLLLSEKKLWQLALFVASIALITSLVVNGLLGGL